MVTVRLARGRAAHVPAGGEWLSPREQAVEAALRFPKRRSDWRLGRWVAKHAVLECLADDGIELAPADIEILPEETGAPTVRFPARSISQSVSLSISHSHGVGLAAAARAMVGLGCDVERIEPHTTRFVADHFTTAEQARVARAHPRKRAAVVTLIWSAKEATLKVLGEGMRLDTRALNVDLSPDAPAAWGARGTTLGVEGTGRRFRGWGWADDGFVWTVVGNQMPALIPWEISRPW